MELKNIELRNVSSRSVNEQALRFHGRRDGLFAAELLRTETAFRCPLLLPELLAALFEHAFV